MKEKWWIIVLPLLLAVAGIWVTREPAATVTEGKVRFRTVVLDAGHGGVDGGTTGRAGTLEKDLNLVLALRTAEFLRFFGVETVMTRTEDVSLHTSENATIATQKAEDLRARGDLAERTPNAVFLSIHQNFYGDTISHGAQTFYRADNVQGGQLSELLQTSLRTLDSTNHRKAAPNPNKNYLLSRLKCPAVIVECGFLSHPEEEQRLRSDTYQGKICLALTAGVLTFLHGSPPVV